MLRFFHKIAWKITNLRYWMIQQLTINTFWRTNVLEHSVIVASLDVPVRSATPEVCLVPLYLCFSSDNVVKHTYWKYLPHTVHWPDDLLEKVSEMMLMKYEEFFNISLLWFKYPLLCWTLLNGLEARPRAWMFDTSSVFLLKLAEGFSDFFLNWTLKL